MFFNHSKKIFFYMILVLIKSIIYFSNCLNIANLIYHATVIFIIPSEIAKLK